MSDLKNIGNKGIILTPQQESIEKMYLENKTLKEDKRDISPLEAAIWALVWIALGVALGLLGIV